MFVFLLLFANLLISQIQLIHLGYGVEHDSYFADINHKIDLAYEVKFNRHFAVAAAASMSAGNLAVHTLLEGEAEIVGKRLREVLV